MITLKSYLRGEWVEGRGDGATLANPTTGEPVGRTSTEGIDFGAVVAHAREVGGPTLRKLTFAERGKLSSRAGSVRTGWTSSLATLRRLPARFGVGFVGVSVMVAFLRRC